MTYERPNLENVWDLDYLIYGPLDPEVFLAYYNVQTANPDVLSYIMQNQVYLPEYYFEMFMIDANKRDADKKCFTSSEIRLALRHTLAPVNFLAAFAAKYPTVVGQHKNSPSWLLRRILVEPKALLNSHFSAAMNPSSPIVESAPVILQAWHAVRPEHIDYSIEPRVNQYLLAQGWDKETLEATPLKMKLEIIA